MSTEQVPLQRAQCELHILDRDLRQAPLNPFIL